MSNIVFNTLNNLGRVVQNNSSVLLSTVKNSIILSQTRGTKHYLPKWKKLRAQKVIKVNLPNYQKEKQEEEEADASPEKIRSKMKQHGLQPAKPWIEKPTFVSCTGEIFEPYVPPEGDGKFSVISKKGATQRADFMKKKGSSYMAVRKIRSFDEDFTLGEFEEDCPEIYKKAHEAIANKDENEMRLYLTEKAYPEAEFNTQDKTIRWKFIELLEPPRVVHARNTNILTKENVYSQLTVRLHSTQTLAIYDRFGRLMHGSEIVKKDVLEYIVFEKHLANKYGSWRIHGKIIPPWMPEKEYSERTFLKPPESEPELESNKSKSPVETTAQPQVVTA